MQLIFRFIVNNQILFLFLFLNRLCFEAFCSFCSEWTNLSCLCRLTNGKNQWLLAAWTCSKSSSTTKDTDIVSMAFRSYIYERSLICKLDAYNCTRQLSSYWGYYAIELLESTWRVLPLSKHIHTLTLHTYCASNIRFTSTFLSFIIVPVCVCVLFSAFVASVSYFWWSVPSLWYPCFLLLLCSSFP